MKKVAGFWIGGGRIARGSGKAAIDRAKELEGQLGARILIVDAEMVFGREHLEIAVEHARRAFDRGTNVASSLTMEILLYASGERQLSTAIDKMGVDRDTEEIVVIVSPPPKAKKVCAELGISRDDSVLEGKAENLGRYGIPPKAISSVPRERVLDLVLEKVAVVDLLK